MNKKSIRKRKAVEIVEISKDGINYIANLMVYLLISFAIFGLSVIIDGQGGIEAISALLFLLGFSIICARIAPYFEITTNIKVRVHT